MSQTYVALMRGINVGGRNSLPMKALVGIFEAAGCANVRTYIQSGNVIFECAPDAAGNVPSEVARRITDRFGYDVPVVLRSASELESAVERHPFKVEAEDPRHLHIGFLDGTPSVDQVASLDPSRSSVDSFEVIGSEVHLYVPGGMGRTKLTTDYFDRRLGAVMTVRNWRTVHKLVEMSKGG